MDRIEFYKMSIAEYPNHKNKGSVINSVKFLKEELRGLQSAYSAIKLHSDGFRCEDIEKDLSEMREAIRVGEDILNKINGN